MSEKEKLSLLIRNDPDLLKVLQDKGVDLDAFDSEVGITSDPSDEFVVSTPKKPARPDALGKDCRNSTIYQSNRLSVSTGAKVLPQPNDPEVTLPGRKVKTVTINGLKVNIGTSP